MNFDWHTVLWRSPSGSEGSETYQSKEHALEGARILLSRAYIIHAIQHGGQTIMDSKAIHLFFNPPRSK
jgi:hypothetical protein